MDSSSLNNPNKDEVEDLKGKLVNIIENNNKDLKLNEKQNSEAKSIGSQQPQPNQRIAKLSFKTIPAGTAPNNATNAVNENNIECIVLIMQ